MLRAQVRVNFTASGGGWGRGPVVASTAVAATTPGVLLKEPVIGAAVRVSVELKAHEHEQPVGAALVGEGRVAIGEPAPEHGELRLHGAGGERMQRGAELSPRTRGERRASHGAVLRDSCELCRRSPAMRRDHGGRPAPSQRAGLPGEACRGSASPGGDGRSTPAALRVGAGHSDAHAQGGRAITDHALRTARFAAKELEPPARGSIPAVRRRQTRWLG